MKKAARWGRNLTAHMSAVDGRRRHFIPVAMLVKNNVGTWNRSRFLLTTASGRGILRALKPVSTEGPLLWLPVGESAFGVGNDATGGSNTVRVSRPFTARPHSLRSIRA